MRDVDRGHLEIALDAQDLGAHLDAQLGVEIRQRLVHQKQLRLAHDCATHRDALALPTRERAWLLRQHLAQAERRRRLAHTTVDLRLRHVSLPQAECHVGVHVHVRVERVVLEDHRDVALLRGQVVDDAPADRDGPVGDLLEARDHAQGRRLAAAGRADEHEELAVVDVERQVEHGLDTVVVDLVDLVEDHLSHRSTSRR